MFDYRGQPHMTDADLIAKLIEEWFSEGFAAFNTTGGNPCPYDSKADFHKFAWWNLGYKAAIGEHFQLHPKGQCPKCGETIHIIQYVEPKS